MPSVAVTVLSHHDDEWKRQVLHVVRDAVMDAFALKTTSIFVYLREIKPEFFLADESRTDKFTLIELSPLAGRSDEEKRALVRGVTVSLVKKMGIPAHDVQVIFYDVPKNSRGADGELVSFK